MSRFALALAWSLIAVTAFAQTDPRTNSGGVPPSPTIPNTVGAGDRARVTQHVVVGERAPDFELADAAGVRSRLRETRGTWVALFFTDRREDLPRIASLAVTLDSLHVHAVVVVTEKLGALGTWHETPHPNLVTFADERGDISSLYGLWDNSRGAARQGLFLLDPQGVVRMELLGQKVSAPSLPALVQSAVEGL